VNEQEEAVIAAGRRVKERETGTRLTERSRELITAETS